MRRHFRFRTLIRCFQHWRELPQPERFFVRRFGVIEKSLYGGIFPASPGEFRQLGRLVRRQFPAPLGKIVHALRA